MDSGWSDCVGKKRRERKLQGIGLSGGCAGGMRTWMEGQVRSDGEGT